MPGTREGGFKAAATIKAKYGDDYFRKRMGEIGRKGKTGGFASKKVGKDGLTGPQRASKVRGKESGHPKKSS